MSPMIYEQADILFHWSYEYHEIDSILKMFQNISKSLIEHFICNFKNYS